MNVTLHPEMEEFVREIVASGVYQSPEDVIHHALLILKYSEEDWTLEELKREIQIGLEAIEKGEVINGKEAFAMIRNRYKDHFLSYE